MDSPEVPEANIRRLFIGNISKLLAQDPDDIKNRISKFGTIKSDFELHHNEVKELSFGYIDVEILDKDYTRLKNALNGVNYKGSKLVIDIAKDNYQKRWEVDHDRDNERVEAKMIKNRYEHWKKLENIKMTYKDRQEIIRGRMRKSPRKDIKKMTFRVNFNGDVKIVRCWKTKLWGYEKNKNLRDLVYRFSSNVWKDGNDHIVERFVKPLRLSQNGQTLTIERVDNDKATRDTEILKDLGDDEEDEEEKERNNKVLASLLGSFDFDKPINPKDEDNDEYGHSDYEYEAALNEGSDEEVTKSGNVGEIEYVKEGEFAKEEPKSVTFNENDDDMEEEEEQQHHHQGEQLPEEDKMDVDEDDLEDHEFIPTFGQSKPDVSQEEAPRIAEGTISNTETLRTLFNAEEEEAASFKLIEESDEDIDQTKKIIAEDVIIPENNITSIITPKLKNRKGLFFPHFDSPFLVAQTQLNKLNTNVNFDEWEHSFWDKRSEWTKEFKRRKRDVLRQLRKKNAKNARVVI